VLIVSTYNYLCFSVQQNPALLIIYHRLWQHCRDTYVEQDPLETTNNRNDRAIRLAASWYASHLAENGIDAVKVVLLTNDKAHLQQSVEQGICVYTGSDDGSFYYKLVVMWKFQWICQL